VGALSRREVSKGGAKGILRCEGLASFIVSSDGKRLYAKTMNDFSIFDLDSQKLIVKVELPRNGSHWGSLGAMALAPGDRELFTWDATHRLLVWDAAKGTLTGSVQLDQDTRSPSIACFVPDRSAIVTGGFGAKALVWDGEGATVRLDLGKHSDKVGAIALSPDGKVLAACSQGPLEDDDKPSLLGGHHIHLWSTGDWKHLRDIGTTWRTEDGAGKRYDMTHSVRAFVFSRDGGTLYSVGGKDLRSWDVASGAELHEPLALGAPSAAALVPGGRQLAVGLDDGRVLLIDTATFAVARTIAAHRNKVVSLGFLADGQTLVTGSSDETIRFFDIATGEPLAHAEGHAAKVNAVACSPDGRTIASVAEDRTICLWDFATGRLLHRFERPVAAKFVGFSPDGRSILVDEPDHAFEREKDPIFSWIDVSSGEIVERLVKAKKTETLTGDGGKVLGKATISYCDAKKAVTRDQKRVALTDAGSRTLVCELGADMRDVATIESNGYSWPMAAISPTGDRVALAPMSAMDYTVRIVDVSTGRLLAEARNPDPDASITGIGFTPDGKQLVAEDCGPTARFFDATTGEFVRKIEIGSTVFSPDGELVAGLGPTEDRRGRKQAPTVEVHSRATGELLAKTEIEPGVTPLAFAPDGRSFVAGDAAGGVSIFEVPGR
jgi:WD40 repeat protein